MRIDASEIEVDLAGWPALRGATVMNIKTGEVHGLVGENGSGKSTFMRVLSGTLPPKAKTSGSLRLDGQEVLPFYNRRRAKAHKIYLVPQDPTVFGSLSVLDNAFLGNEVTNRFGGLNHTAARLKLEKLLSDLHWALPLEEKGALLSMSDRQKLTVVRVLLTDPEANFILFDEPTTQLAEGEVEDLLATFTSLSQRGIGVIVISHNPADIIGSCHKISVMNEGRVTVTHRREAITTADALRELMYGYTPSPFTPSRKPAQNGEVVLDVQIEKLTDSNNKLKVKNQHFKVNAGEIFCVFGDPDSGLHELFDFLSGCLPPSRYEGHILLSGKEISDLTTKNLRANGFAFVPAQKGERGLIPQLTIQENLLLTDSRPNIWIWGDQAEGVSNYRCGLLHVHRHGLSTRVNQLSGGYQQRVLLAREFGITPRIIVMHNPSQGIDVATKDDIYDHVFYMQEQGAAIILLSSNPEEKLLANNHLLLS